MVMGDSLSAAHGIDPNKGWVSLLQKHLQKTNDQINVINVSVGGDTTQDGLLKLPTVVAKHKPCMVMVELGGNDALRGLSIKQIHTNLSKIIEQLKKQHIRVVLIGVRIPPNYGPEYTKQFQQMYLTLSKQHEIDLVPQLLLDVADDPKMMQVDGIHPKAAGQPQMLKNVLNRVTF